MSIDNFSREYQPPKIPTHWGTEERRYAQAVADVLDDIYLKYGRLGKKELSAALGKEITDATGNVSLLQQTATNFLLEVANSKIYRYPDEAALIAALAGMEPPVSMEVGLLWLDTTLNAVKRCSSVSPLTWQDVKANELHTSYIDIAADLLKLFSGAKIQLLSGSEIELLSGSTIKVISGSGTSYISLDNSREDNCFLFFGGETPETAPAAFWRDGTIKNVANTYVQTAADNADATHGIVMDVFFPSDVTLVDKVMLSCKFSAFRAYETGAASGGSATATSESGGGAEKTSRGGGGETVTSVANGSGNTGAKEETNTGSSDAFNTGSGGTGDTGPSNAGSTAGVSVLNTSGASGTTQAHTHSHGHTHEIIATHKHSGPSHTHSVQAHTHPIAAHYHSLNNHTHSVTVSSHTHIVDIDAHTHDVSIPAHTHDMTYGIYEGTTPAACTVYVDGSAVAGLTGVGPFINIDIAGAFLKSGGKIVRDAFHTVEIRPNRLGRISAHLYVKTTQVSKVAGTL